jgi:hypothetical protein
MYLIADFKRNKHGPWHVVSIINFSNESLTFIKYWNKITKQNKKVNFQHTKKKKKKPVINANFKKYKI